MNYSGLKIRKSSTYTHIHTHTSRRQLKLIFLDTLDRSEYSDTDISISFNENIVFSVKKQNETNSK